jgi:hypothetical protein
MSLIKNTTRGKKPRSNTTTRFSIALNDDDSVEFRPTGTFAHVNAEQVFKIITTAEVDATSENNNNKVNFKLTGSNKLLGFINYYDNDLDNESGDVEVQETVDSLKADLAEVKMEDITLPMTAGEADDLIANL